MDWEHVSKELQRPLDPKHVQPAPQGKYGDFVDGYHVVSEANRIFGHGGWSYIITSMDLVCRIETPDREGNPQVRVGYKCTVRVTIGESVKEGSAVGGGIAKAHNEVDAHESAVKEAETDALKRALRTYGNTFGLALYDKTRAHVGVEPALRDPVKIADSLIAVVQKQATLDAVNKTIGAGKFDEAWQWLAENHEEHSARVRKAVDERKADLTAEQVSA